MKVKCSVCGKIVNSRPTKSGAAYPGYHFKGSDVCHGFFERARKVEGTDEVSN